MAILEKEQGQEIKEAKKRGRPPKTKNEQGIASKSLTENEKVESIQMTHSNKKEEPLITLNDIQNKWNGVFTRYGRDLTFDKLANKFNSLYLNNPFIQNSRIKQASSTALKRNKETLQKALVSPMDNEQFFRETSMYLTFTNYVYNSMLRLNRDVPEYHYYILPKYIDKKIVKEDSFAKESIFVDKVVKTFNPKLTFKTISMQVAEEGKTTYVIRKSYDSKNVNFFNLQKLNSDEVKITGYGSKQPFIVDFNFMLFLNPSYDLSQYPPFFTDIFNALVGNGTFVLDNNKKSYAYNPEAPLYENATLEFRENTWLYWVKLPQSDVYTFCSDASHPLAIPEITGMLLDFTELNDYKALQTALLAKTVTSILTATVPMSKDAKAGDDNTALSPDLILGYEGHFADNIAGNVLPFFAPFTDYKFFSVDNQPENMNIIYNRVRDLIATSGNATLNSISDKPSIASVKAAQRTAASKAHYLTLQFKNFLNNVINEQFDLKQRWEIEMWGDIYDDEEFKNAKELLLAGAVEMYPKVLSYEDMTLEDARSARVYIDYLGLKLKKEENSTTKETSKVKENGEIKTVGRPAINDNDIENDNTDTSKDEGNNVSDTKEFTQGEQSFTFSSSFRGKSIGFLEKDNEEEGE